MNEILEELSDILQISYPTTDSYGLWRMRLVGMIQEYKAKALLHDRLATALRNIL